MSSKKWVGDNKLQYADVHIKMSGLTMHAIKVSKESAVNSTKYA